MFLLMLIKKGVKYTKGSFHLTAEKIVSVSNVIS